VKEPKKKKRNKKTKIVREVNEVDAIWEDQLKQEAIEAKVEKASKDSRALTKSGIHKLRSGLITNVSEIMEIKPHVAQNLLHKVNWDKSKLLTEYFNDPEEFLKKENLDKDSISLLTNSEKLDEPPIDEEICCSICFDDYAPTQMTTIEACGHMFCNVCWCDNLSLQISTGHTLDITCMNQGCTELVPAHIVQSLVTPEMCSKYNSFLGKTFVENSKDIIWCTYPGCELALSEPVSEGIILVLTCACGNRLCWSCRKEAHPPIGCENIEKFEKEAQDEDSLKFMVANKLDAETLRWMHENTKQCPFCDVSVQKNDGCFCMTCANCHKQWCWLCRGDWSTHPDHFSCKTLNADRSQLSDKPIHQDDESYQKRLAVEQLAKFYGQYYDQSQAMELEGNRDNRQKDEDKIKELTKHQEDRDVSFYIQGRLTVKKCRESLKYSYVHSYYNRDKNDHILQLLQENLAMCIEKLAQTLQKPSENLSPPEIRNATRISTIALENILSHICGDNLIEEIAEKEQKKKRFIIGKTKAKK
jgi:ariadne-1